MATVVLTQHLAPYTGGQRELECPADDVAALLEALDREMPGVRRYICDEHGALRRHVNLFIDGVALRDRVRLTDRLAPKATVHVLQAVSGG
ncbi:MAG: MoaD/ThiS family protein [Planctomycetota bacterium]